jgi:hypothetical protein
VTQVFLNPIQPLIQLYFSVPFASLIAFMAIYLGIAKNSRFSEFIKFNAFQAILLDICLVFPALLESVFRPPRYGTALQIYSYYQSAVSDSYILLMHITVPTCVYCFVEEQTDPAGWVVDGERAGRLGLSLTRRGHRRRKSLTPSRDPSSPPILI